MDGCRRPQLQVLEDALAVIARDPDLEDIWEHASGAPIVLGEWITAGAAPDSSDVLEACKRTANFWVTLQSSSGSGSEHPALLSTDLPILKSVYCGGFLYRASCSGPRLRRLRQTSNRPTYSSC
jgi:hypothetical protein